MRLLVIFSALLLFFGGSCQRNPTLLEQVLSDSNPKLKAVLQQKEAHEIQILLTQINRDAQGKPHFQESSFQLDEDRYFYPASTAKLPIAILTLQKIKELNSQGILISKDSPFVITNTEGEFIIANDSTHPSQKLTLAQQIKKIFLVSDNDAYNYLFDFLGRDYIHRELSQKGLLHTQIHHKFLLGADNVNTWKYTFFNSDEDTLYHQASIQAIKELQHHKLKGVLKGKGYMDGREIVNRPMDFGEKNRISIRDLNGILQRIIFPEVFSPQQQFDLTPEDYQFLRFWMSRTPAESKNPVYDPDTYWDSYGKFLIYGDQKGQMGNDIRIYNKVGYAYGTLTDVAYIRNREKDIEFFLTATLLVNNNQIFNDDVYEFETVGIPFLAELGRGVYRVLEKE
jgi:hypothetical protein